MEWMCLPLASLFSSNMSKLNPSYENARQVTRGIVRELRGLALRKRLSN